MRQSMIAQQAIQAMVDRIVEGFDPEKVILFGSFARGTATRDSDVDLLVVMALKGSRRQQCIDIWMRLGGLGLPKDVVLLTPQEFEKQKELPGTIGRCAALEGRVLYERRH